MKHFFVRLRFRCVLFSRGTKATEAETEKEEKGNLPFLPAAIPLGFVLFSRETKATGAETEKEENGNLPFLPSPLPSCLRLC